MEAYRSIGKSLRFGTIDLYETTKGRHTYQYLLNREQQLLMTITITSGEGIGWEVVNDVFHQKMRDNHSDRWDDRFEFVHPLYGKAKLVKNYMFKLIESAYLDDYSICYVNSSGNLCSSSVVDAELNNIGVDELKELGY